jgi:hypothetical protein
LHLYLLTPFQHAFHVNFGLDGHAFSIPNTILSEITSTSYDGSSSAKSDASSAKKSAAKMKAILMWSYQVPLRFTNKFSNGADKTRTIEILFALVSLNEKGEIHPTGHSIIFCDHNHLMKGTIINLHSCPPDKVLDVGAEVCLSLLFLHLGSIIVKYGV